MKISESIFDDLVLLENYQATFQEHIKKSLNKPLLIPQVSNPRLRDAHYAWRKDMTRVESGEDKLINGLDHFKQAAHIAYWLRRMAPVVEYSDRFEGVEQESELYDGEKHARKFILKYGNEFLAFDFGFQICLYFELYRTDGKKRNKPPVLSSEFLNDMCYMMKFKHVSPHSLYLVYRSIFV
jgi:hypothetical protein